MADKSQRQTQGRDGVLSSLNTAIGALNRAKEATSVTTVKATFTSAGVLLTAIKVGFLQIYIGRSPADVCRTRWPTKWIMSN